MAESSFFWVHKDHRGQWYWTFKASNGLTIARSSESYVNRNDCLHSIRLIKENGPSAWVADLSGPSAVFVGALP